MKTTTLAISFALTGLLCAAACSSSSSTGSSSSGAGGSTSTSTSSSSGGPPATSCTKPGDKGNANGVGEYCTPSGGECAKFTYATVCLADLGQDQWFCTHISCANDAECGSGAYCNKQSAGSACVPDKCGGGPDGGMGTGGGSATDGGGTDGG